MSETSAGEVQESMEAHIRNPEGEVAGSLQRHQQAWESLSTATSWHLDIIRHGLPLPFHSIPHSNMRFPNRSLGEEDRAFARSEIGRLLKLRAISEVSTPPAVISPLGVVPKKNGKKRLIVDLRWLNTYLDCPSFKLEGIDKVAELASSGDHMVTGDLQDGYFHVAILPEHRTYLGFEWEGKFFHYNVLPFGLSFAPLVFTKILRPIVEHFRLLGIRIIFYIDDFLIISATLRGALRDRDLVLDTLRSLGWYISAEKSSLIPEQQKQYLGFIVVTSGESPCCKVPGEKLRKVRHDVARLLKLAEKGQVSSKKVASVVGYCCSLTRAVIPARMYLRDVYRCLGRNGQRDCLISLSSAALENLRWWRDHLADWNGKTLLPLPIDRTLTTDASEFGWGGHLDSTLLARGSFDRSLRQSSSNKRELTAVLYSLHSFVPHLRERSVLLLSDNATVVAHVNNFGGRAVSLDQISKQIHLYCAENRVTIRAKHIRGLDNILADKLSRQRDPDDWTLKDNVFRQLERIWGPHTVDRFASFETTKLKRYNSRFNDQQSEAVDCFTQNSTSRNFGKGRSGFVEPLNGKWNIGAWRISGKLAGLFRDGLLTPSTSLFSSPEAASLRQQHERWGRLATL
eukprot:TRINITY_DN203_c0_g1_i1.p1 TRINITY_DN203_c0_g1~~TRINITY_DN203_c0_g1_i1.p1  ORF type:complete len:627 (+),score=30.83 TRINITY_DN203_c0_g1_i1:642-2522(+)